MSDQMPDERRRRKGRSPSYPGIALGEAIEKAAVLYEKEGRHPAPVDVITGHWGYKPKTGPGLVAIAALKKFALLEDEGDNGVRQARLTPLALSIILHETDSPDRQRWVREAALAPPIHAELWKQFDGWLPSDQNLRRMLVLDRAFTESGARQFIRQFKDTIAFAGLAEPDKIPEAQPPQHRPSGERTVTRSVGLDAVLAGGPVHASSGLEGRVEGHTEGQVEIRTLQLPVNMPVWPELRVPYPMTEEAWEQMLTILNVFKVGMVKQADADPGQPPERSEAGQSE